MSGDVQPRKRKDKKRKKDELGVEEPRGTAAVLGEGDVFMHSQHDHGTGGHWCAKIIFFSLLAVLIGLVGLIILENRGLSELEANSVESRYSGVLEGWLEDAPDDDHHDEHTLDLKNHDDEVSVDDHGDDNGPEDEEHGDEKEHSDEDDDNGEDDHDDDQDDGDSEEQGLEQTVDEEDRRFSYSKYFGGGDDDDQEDDDQDNEDDQEAGDNDDDDENDENLQNEIDEDQDDDDDDDDESENNADDEDISDDDDDENESAERNDDEDDNEIDFDDEQDNLKTLLRDNEDEEEHEEQEEDEEIEVEKIEKEASEEEEPISLELPTLPEDDDDDDDNEKDIEASDEDATPEDDGDDEDDEFLEADEEPPVVERITAPAGKPFVEVEEDEVSSEKPPDTLEEEEEYEKQQEELRREKEQASHMWLKLVVGGALLVATHAVVRRATAPRDVSEREEQVREDTPLTDRRMTLIPEEPPVAPKRLYQESSKPLEEEVVKKIPSFGKSAPVPRQESEEDEDQEEPDDDEEDIEEPKKEVEKESYSDEEVEDDEEEVFEQKEEKPKPAPVAKKSPILAPVEKKPPEPEPEEEISDDVEIIEDEPLEEEEEDDEEDISDVDDVELLTRLEAKYGRLPEPERPGQKYKDGGNSLEDEWPGEPSDSFWLQQLDSAEQDLRQGEWLRAAERAGVPELRDCARARYVGAVALDRAAEAGRDNQLLTRAIAAYLHLLKMNERLSDKHLLEVANRTLDRIQFRGNYMGAEPVYRLLIRRFPDDPAHRNNLSVSFLMANRADLADEVLKETLHRWPDNRIALAHHAFILKTKHNRLEEAVKAFQKALEGDEGAACEPRFYYHLGDALLLLGRFAEAHEVHKRAAKLGHFLSPSQRSLYNVPRLKSRSWWNVEETPYVKLARALEESWRDILKEGEEAKALYEKEKEGLKERGEWSQLDLFVRGREVPERCARAPVTCSVVKAEPAAAGCRRGQVKFSAMQPGTHVRPHVGPTNCRLRMHLGLSNTTDTYIRVDQETRQWHEGKVLMFDDSFEHEVWHNGTGARLVLIVDVWHPGLTPAERRQLPAI